MFSLIGLILLVSGLVTNSNAELYHRSLDINVNLYWGLVLLVFGGSMLTLAWRGSTKVSPPDSAAREKQTDEVTVRR
jgi:hypothetical protein